MSWRRPSGPTPGSGSGRRPSATRSSRRSTSACTPRSASGTASSSARRRGNEGLDIDPRQAGIGLVALADGAWIELLMAATDFSVDDALALCDDYIDMVLERGRSGRGGAAGA